MRLILEISDGNELLKEPSIFVQWAVSVIMLPEYVICGIQ
jgi:hypothetical protein